MITSTMCTVQNRNHAERVFEWLFSAGFSNQDISALLPNKVRTRDSAVIRQPLASGATCVNNGCILGQTLGLLKGLSALSIRGLGQCEVAGPLYAALRAAAVDAVGLTGAFIRMGIPRFEARRFEAKAKGGNLLVFVRTDSDDAQSRVMEIFNAAYAVDICSAHEIDAPMTRHLRSLIWVEAARVFSSTG